MANLLKDYNKLLKSIEAKSLDLINLAETLKNQKQTQKQPMPVVEESKKTTEQFSLYDVAVLSILSPDYKIKNQISLVDALFTMTRD